MDIQNVRYALEQADRARKKAQSAEDFARKLGRASDQVQVKPQKSKEIPFIFRIFERSRESYYSRETPVTDYELTTDERDLLRSWLESVADSQRKYAAEQEKKVSGNGRED